jgi:hypothetical protein
MALTMRAGESAWMTKLHEAFVTALRAAGDAARGVDFSIAEEYRNPPPDLDSADDAAALGWTCRIVDGVVVEFSRTPQPDVDCYIVLDYPVFAELATLVVDGDADKQNAMEQRQAKAIADGTLIVTGALDNAPPCLADVHDAMARVTDASTRTGTR